MAKLFTDENSILASVRGGFDVTPSAAELAIPTRAIMVSDDNMTVTGILVDQSTSHTTAPLKAGLMYPFRFKVISSVSTGSVKGYY